MNTNSYFYIPKEIMTENFCEYSAESKLLFAMLLSNASTTAAVMSTAKLIDELGVRKIAAIQKELARELSKISESKESESE